MLNSASDYQTFIEIKDHFNVDCIHIPPCIERMGNLYSKYSEKTHLKKHFFVKLLIEMRYRMRVNMRC